VPYYSSTEFPESTEIPAKKTSITHAPAGRGRSRRRTAAGLAWVLGLVGLTLLSIGYSTTPHRPPTANAAVPRDPSHMSPAQFAAEGGTALGWLQTRYAGAYTSTHEWQAALSLMATMDYMKGTGSRAYLRDLANTYHAHHSNGQFVDHYYDDDGWWVLTWVKAYELTGNQAYLAQAKSIFTAVTKGWSATCGGGVLWKQHKPYKNAITNLEFLRGAVLLHDLTPGDSYYANWAVREWNWFAASGMLTSSHLVVDGLHNCKPVLTWTKWTYNQGMLIGGLALLSGMTGQSSLLARAEQVAHAVMHSPKLSPHGILREPCAPLACGKDAPEFKGVFMQNLYLLYQRTGNPAYRTYMHRNAVAMLTHDTRGKLFGLSWAGPFQGPDMATQTAGLYLLNTQLPGGGLLLPRNAAAQAHSG
jgi:predicted alpha-1,6-mannanase (GH76 family)